MPDKETRPGSWGRKDVQKRFARGLKGARVAEVRTAEVPGSPSVLATFVLEDGTELEVSHVRKP